MVQIFLIKLNGFGSRVGDDLVKKLDLPPKIGSKTSVRIGPSWRQKQWQNERYIHHKRRRAVEQVQEVLDVSERRVCQVLGHPLSTQGYKKRIAEDEEILTTRMVALASEYGRYTCTCSAV